MMKIIFLKKRNYFPVWDFVIYFYELVFLEYNADILYSS